MYVASAVLCASPTPPSAGTVGRSHKACFFGRTFCRDFRTPSETYTHHVSSKCPLHRVLRSAFSSHNLVGLRLHELGYSKRDTYVRAEHGRSNPLYCVHALGDPKCQQHNRRHATVAGEFPLGAVVADTQLCVHVPVYSGLDAALIMRASLPFCPAPSLGVSTVSTNVHTCLIRRQLSPSPAYHILYAPPCLPARWPASRSVQSRRSGFGNSAPILRTAGIAAQHAFVANASVGLFRSAPPRSCRVETRPTADLFRFTRGGERKLSRSGMPRFSWPVSGPVGSGPGAWRRLSRCRPGHRRLSQRSSAPLPYSPDGKRSLMT